ncbi:MAG: discoidin domain-containing protein, partial [Gemmatimonadota bacterium]|nr:discoidin domain-containing protein [Gemmatimonadota bacterium]
ALDDLAYHGHRVAVVWDRDGSRYGRGRGLMLFADGRKIAEAPDIGRIAAALPPRRRGGVGAGGVARLHNWAVNNGGAAFPLATASRSAPGFPPFYAVDGSYWYHRSPPNRWTPTGPARDTDWFQVDFGVERPVEMVKLYFVQDDERPDLVAEGGSSVVGDSAPLGPRGSGNGIRVRAPAAYRLEAWIEGAWREIPRQRRRPVAPTGHRANVVAFDEIRTAKLRVVLEHLPDFTSGLTEFEAWGRGPLPAPPATADPANLAFPATVTASYAAPGTPVDEVRDMRIAFTRYARPGWTARGSPNPEDWIEARFDGTRSVGVVDVYLLGSRPGIEAPASFRVQFRDGDEWRDVVVRSRVPAAPAAWARNRTEIEPVSTEGIRVVFDHALPATTGVAELMIWSDQRDDR